MSNTAKGTVVFDYEKSVILTNFKVPKTCHHRWVLVVGPHRATIQGLKNRKKLEYQTFSIDQPEPPWMGKITPRQCNDIQMDWMQESIEHLRAICGA